MPRLPKPKQSVTIDLLHADVDVLRDALHVITLTPHIRAYLETNDPKALEQALRALAQSDSAK